MPLIEQRLIDHHCHGVRHGPLDRDGFLGLLSESFRPAAAGTTHFDKPLGLAVRKHCAPLLDLAPLAAAEDYIARRLELGEAEVGRRLLRACGLDGLIVDTGHNPGELTAPAALGTLAGAPAWEVARIEAVAEDVVTAGVTADIYARRFGEALEQRARAAVGLKSIVAYRATFAIEQTAPSAAEVVRAAGEWLAAGGRLTHPVLLRHGLFVAAELCQGRRMPLQLHVGIGDPDVLMHACDPTVFTPFLRATEAMEVPVTLLHNYPFIREAGWLAEVFSNVYLDVGVVLAYVGPAAERVLRQALELAPFGKHLYSSDAYGLPELHYLGAVQFRIALGRVLGDWIADGFCTRADAVRIADWVCGGNARRIYAL
jgi:predicted TIM-barrel fold metal-dependent hydrolase